MNCQLWAGLNCAKLNAYNLKWIGKLRNLPGKLIYTQWLNDILCHAQRRLFVYFSPSNNVLNEHTISNPFPRRKKNKLRLFLLFFAGHLI